jgi:hypothetical protein
VFEAGTSLEDAVVSVAATTAIANYLASVESVV